MESFKRFSNILSLYITNENILDLSIKWRENHRKYHGLFHLDQILVDIEKDIWFKDLSKYEKHALLLAAFFHDAIYNPKRKDNEDQSIIYFKKCFKNDDPKMINTVCELIDITKYRKRPTIRLQKLFWDADNAGFKKGYDYLLKTERLIRKEFSHISNEQYKEGRIKFLETCIGLFGEKADKDIKKLIEFVQKTY